MADKKISELQALTTLDTADIMVAVDISANETKKITGPNLATYINSQFPAETIRDTIGAMLTGNTETDITVTHDDANDKINFVVSVSASNLPSSIDAAKIGDGSVSNTEFERLDGVTSNIQTQIDTKLNKAGGTMTGVLAMGSNAITTSSTVDGRDVSTDGTKLDGIETAATADQTNAEIRTAVESASDSNVFTDADHTKLNGIEASATADQTNAEIRTAVEAATDSNVFTDADHTKLNSIESSADVTDTANVTSAGALMDSELTNLAAVKGINQALTTTSSPTFAGITGPLTGNASTATTLATARTINLGGEVTGSASFNGGSDITITGTIAANSIGINELALNDGSNGQFIQTDGSGTITFASAIGSSVINNSAANRITTVNANASDFDAESNLTFDGSTLALTGNMTASGTIDGVDISARDSVLTSTTTTANAALPKAGGAMTGAITSAGDFTIDVAGDINLDAGGSDISLQGSGSEYGKFNLTSNNLNIHSSISDGDIVFKGNDGGSAITALTLDMSDAGAATFNGTVYAPGVSLNDNETIFLGNSADLRIYHDGSNSYIQDTGTGDLKIISDGNAISFQKGTSETMAFFDTDAGCELYHDNSKKFETTSSGIDVTGNIVVSGTVDGVDVAACNTTANAALPKAGGTMTGTLKLNDNVVIYLGTGDDLQLKHDGSNSYLRDVGQGDLIIEGENRIVLRSVTGSEKYIECTKDNSVELFHNNVKKAETVSGGLTVSGTLTATTLAGSLPYSSLTGTPTIPTNNNQLSNGAGYIGASGGTMTGDLKFNDSIQAKFGNSEDFKIYHNGSQTILDDSGTGSVELRSNTFGIATSGGSASMASFVEGGAVNLYNNGTLRANTTSSGFAVTGDMTASGNVTAYSDERLKSDIKTIDNALDKVSQMRGVTFTKDDKLSSGVIAQEMEKVAPELVIDGEYKSVAYGNTVGYLIEAIKELKAEIEILKKDK